MAAPRPSFNLGSFLDKDKLKTDGSNFTNWFRTLRILLVPLKMAYVLKAAVGDEPPADASQDEKNVYLSKTDDYNLVHSGMLYSMEAELQKRFERMGAYEIITDLKAVFAPQARAEHYEASEAFFSAKMDEHSSVSEHVVKMSGYVQCLNALECQIPDELAVDRVLQSLPPSYKGFVLNYNMQGMTKTLSELFSMLKTAEVEIKKKHAVFMVNKTVEFKKSARRRRERRVARRRVTSQLSLLVRHPNLDPSPALSASTARVMVTGNATTPSTKRIRRLAGLSEETKVYLIYTLLIFS